MDPFGENTDLGEKFFFPIVEDDFPDADNEANKVSITRSFQIFLEDTPDEKSGYLATNHPSEVYTDEEDLPSTDPLGFDTDCCDTKLDISKRDTVSDMDVDPRPEYDQVVIKQEYDWEQEEINIVDDHLSNLSDNPKIRLKELKILLRKETEEQVECWSRAEQDENNGEVETAARYRLRQRPPARVKLLHLDSTSNADGHEKGDMVWSDDSDNDPDYAPHDDEEQKEEENHKTLKFVHNYKFPVKNTARRQSKQIKLLCLYCKNKYKTIVKHMLTVHKNNPDIKSILILPMKSEERKNAKAALLEKVRGNQSKRLEEINEDETEVEKIVNTKEKRQVCFYCKKIVGKVSRHLVTMHQNEPYVKYVMRLPKGSQERKNAFILILNKGNFVYNQEIINSGEGSIITKRRQTTEEEIDQFEPCMYCFGYYRIGTLKRHTERCTLIYREKTFEDISRNHKDSTPMLPNNCNMIKNKKGRGRRKVKPIPANVRVSACFYCKERVRSISKHLKAYHGDKPYMRHLLSLPKGSGERKIAWKLIRNKGNFSYNRDIIANGRGSIICSRKQKGQDDTDNFLSCSNCFGFFKKSSLKRHIEYCKKTPNCKNVTNNVENEDWDVIHSDFSAMDIINSLVKGNLVGEESDILLEVGKNYKKRTVCYYCNKPILKLFRHLKISHTAEAEVKHILSLETGSKERYQALQVIRRKGNFLYNKTVLNTNSGPLITRRISEHINKHNYLPCEFCFGFFTLNTLIKHVYKCERNTVSAEVKNEKLKSLSESKRKREIKAFCTTLLNCPTILPCSINQVLMLLRNTKIGTVAKNDKLITKYGAYQLERKEMSTKIIARNMFYLAKLVVRVNVFEPSISNLLDALNADLFKTFLKSALQVCMAVKEKVAESREKFLRSSIQHCCMIAKSDSLVQRDDTALQQINNFFVTFIEFWSKPLLPSLFEARKPSQPGQGEKVETTHNSVIDWIKQDFIKNLNIDEKSVGRKNDLDDCSSRFGTKKDACLFCRRTYSNIYRHWSRSHQDKLKIKELVSLEKFSTEWKSLVVILKNKGNYVHNVKVLQQKNGCLIRKFGRAVLNGYDDYSPCRYCLGFYKAKFLYMHVKRCPMNPLLKKETPVSSRLRRQINIPLIMSKGESESSTLKSILDQMKNDSLKKIVLKDELIMKFGEMYISKKVKNVGTFNSASQRMRGLARILIQLQKCNSEIKTLADCVHSKNLSAVLKVIKEMSLLRSTKSSAQNLFLILRFSVLTCILILKNECLLEINEDKLKELNESEVMVNQYVLSAQDLIKYEDPIKSVNNPDEGITQSHSIIKKWTKEELNTITSCFSNNIKNGVTPGKFEIENFLNGRENLKSRGWLAVKYQIRNMIVKSERCSSKSKARARDNNGNQITCDTKNTENVCKPKLSDNYGNLVLNECIQPSFGLQTAKPISEAIPNVTHQKDTLSQDLGTSSEQQNKNSSEGLIRVIKNLESHVPLHKPLATVDNHSVTSNWNCPNDSEERTYLLLSSCNSPQGVEYDNHLEASVETESLTYDEMLATFEPLEQLAREPLCTPAQTALFYESIEEDQAKTDFVTINQPISELLSIRGKGSSEENNWSNGPNRNSLKSHSNLYKNKRLKWSWTSDEIHSLLRFFKDHIKQGKLPTKLDCLDCIEENDCLNLRDWVAVKSKVCYIIKSKKKADLKTSEERNQSFKNDMDNDSRSSSKSKRPKIGIGKQQWSCEENEAIENFFKEFINNHNVPGKKDCENCISRYDCLSGRSWVMVKSKVHNIISFKKRKSL